MAKVDRMTAPSRDLERLGGKLAVPDVARVVTVREPGGDFPQVGLPDRFTAERTKALQPRYPAVDQNKFHGAALDARKRAMSYWPNHLFDQLTVTRAQQG